MSPPSQLGFEGRRWLSEGADWPDASIFGGEYPISCCYVKSESAAPPQAFTALRLPIRRSQIFAVLAA